MTNNIYSFDFPSIVCVSFVLVVVLLKQNILKI